MVSSTKRSPARRSYQPTLELLESRTLLDSSPAGHRAYVAHLYQDLLQRPAEPRGLAAWSARLDAGMSRQEVVHHITASPEYRTALIDRWHQTYLARPATARDLAAFLAVPSSRRILTTLLTSDEYYNNRAGGTVVMWVTALYHDLLGHRADAAALGLFARSGAARDDVLRDLLASREWSEDEVHALYQQFLDRPADANGLELFGGALRRGASREHVLAAILSSPEYVQRTATQPAISPRVRHFGRVAENLYQHFLGRPPEAVETDRWIARFTAAAEVGRSLSTDVFAFLNSTEALQTLAARWFLHYFEEPGTLPEVKSSPGVAAPVAALEDGADFFAVLTDLLASDRFFTLSGGTTADLVTNLHRKVLEREPTPEEITDWSARLDGELWRRGVAEFLQTAEATRTVVAHWFQDYLGASAPVASLREEGRVVNWATRLAEYHDYSALLAQFVTSSDYFGFPLELYSQPQVGLGAAPGPFVQPVGLQRGPQSTFVTGEPIISTTYFYWYTTQPPGNRYLLNPDGSDGLTDHPPTLDGFDYLNVDWHRKEFQDMEAAGIDVVLPNYHGWPHSDPLIDPSVLNEIRRFNIEFADPGLRRMVTAQRQLLAEGARPPRIGMFYDTNTNVKNSYDNYQVDLRTHGGKRWFYETIRNFFSHVPAAYWARIDGRPLVFIFHPSRAGGMDQTLADTIRSWFARDFGVSCYLVLGNDANTPLVQRHGSVFWAADRLRTEPQFHVLADVLAADEFYARAGRTPAGYVHRLYDKLLARTPSPEELQAWTAALAATNRWYVADALLRQPESLRTLVARWYRYYLRRPQSIAAIKASREIDGWAASLRRGTPPSRVLAGILASDEFYGMSGNSNEALVDYLYQQVLQRYRDLGGRTSWIGRLRQGSRVTVIADFLETEEAHQMLASEWMWFHLGRNYAGEADGVFEWGAALHPQVRSVACIGPGYDHSNQKRRPPLVVPRENGDFYRSAWESFLLLNRGPFLVHLETWNEFFEGTDIAESLEYGRQYIELTRHYADLFHSRRR